MPLSAQRSYLVCNEALKAVWWNPLVWAAAAESKRDCEMACDEGTLETIGWENKFLYAKTLDMPGLTKKFVQATAKDQQWYQENLIQKGGCV